MSEAIVRTEELTRVYHLGERDVIGIQNVNMEVSKGEFIAIRGPSGSGKTTLLTR